MKMFNNTGPSRKFLPICLAITAAYLIELSEQYATVTTTERCRTFGFRSSVASDIFISPSISPNRSRKRKLVVVGSKPVNDHDINDNDNDDSINNDDPLFLSQDTTTTITILNDDDTSSGGTEEEWNTSLFPGKRFLPPPDLNEAESIEQKKSRSGVKKLIKQLVSKRKRKSSPADIDVYDENKFRSQLRVQGIALMVGLLSGTAVSLFKMGIAAVKTFCYTSGAYGLDAPLVSFLPVFAITSLGGISVAILAALGAFPPGIRGEIDEVDDSSLSFFDELRNCDEEMKNNNGGNESWEKKLHRFDPSYALGFFRKALASIFTLGSGCSLGPEGPSVEVAMSMSRICIYLWPPQTLKIKSAFNESNNGCNYNEDVDAVDGSFKYSQEDVQARIRRNRLILSCGAAAGVSAGFNAPLAGVFFALEVVQAALPSLAIPTLSPTTTSLDIVEVNQESLSQEQSSITAILIASVVSGLVARVLLGNELALHVTDFEIMNPLLELPLYLLQGALAGSVAVAFSQSAKFTKKVFEGDAGPELVKKTFSSLPRFSRPVIGALLCGLVGTFYPQVLFFGYETLNGLLGNNSIPTATLLTLLAAKIFTTAVAAASGLVGGTFAPSIFLGGMCGASFHNIVQSLLGSFAMSPVAAYAMVGAASTLAALFRAPLTASLLMFELTRNYDILIPLLASAGVGSLVSDIVESKIEAVKYRK